MKGEAVEIRVGLGSCGVASGAEPVYEALVDETRRAAAGDVVKRVGCNGMCHLEPMVEVVDPGRGAMLYASVTPDMARAIARRHVRPRTAAAWFDRHAGRRFRGGAPAADTHPVDRHAGAAAAYLSKQHRIVLENCGDIDPLDIDEYIARDGYQALERCVTGLCPDDLIVTVTRSGLRGRGGAGFPTGTKWSIAAASAKASAGQASYVICNGDEGDPGAFMDRLVLESDPHRVVEGLAIAAYAIGAVEGIFYIRAEYPLAVRRIRTAIRDAEARGFLGASICRSAHSLHLEVREGAGAFVCGEETALILSLEGKRGMPRLRPPYPAERGFHGQPTVINNVETLAAIPWIVRHGAEAFAALGTKTSQGTKVFALAGKIERGGLIEVPMGITIREIVEDIGGGIKDGRRFKAVQIGGPSGGCLPERLADTPIDYDALARTGAIMGSGGLVVLDERDCMVDMARYFLRFTQSESCGKCTFCRIGTKRMLEILDRLCEGLGRPDDIDELDTLADYVSRGSLCGLGQTAPNPVSTTLRYFRDEYEAHLHGQCPAGRCPCAHRLPHHRQVHRLHALCAGVPRRRDRLPAVRTARDRPREVHAVRHVLPGVQGRCD